MKPNVPNHYATLGLHRRCTVAQIRQAYRLLAKQHHPDVNPGAPDAMAQIQALNEAYETLSDAARRQTYDRELEQEEREIDPPRVAAKPLNVKQDVQLSLQELLRGQTLTVHVRDPGHPQGVETYRLEVPPETAPGTRFRLKREAPFERGVVLVRVKARSDARFKARGSDVKCDLKISTQRATQGGTEMVRGIRGQGVAVQIPPRVLRGEVIRVRGEGLPKPRGGNGDLLVRILYRPDVRVTRG